jgi:high-affinity nickel-transport protein
MTSLAAILALGFFLGMRHATDPDHVIAVSTIVSRSRSVKRACLVGVAWGIGHSFTVLAVGGGIVLFGWVITPRAGLSMELSVAVMLIVLGLITLRDITRRVAESAAIRGASPGMHSHAHSHGDFVHTHAHGHDPETHPHPPHRTPLSWLDRHLSRLGWYTLIRPLVVGVVHGLAGSTAVALLVMTAIQSPRWSLFYLLVFGAGTIAGMMLITMALSLPFVWTGGRFAGMNRGLRVAAGAISLAFGLFLAFRIGFADGLFFPRGP